MIFNFDSPEGWLPNPSASIIADATAPTQPNCLQLRWGVGTDPLVVNHVSGLVPGDFQLLVRCAFDRLAGDEPYVTIRFEFSDGSVFETQIFKSSLIDENGDQLHGWQFATGPDPGVVGVLANIHVPTTSAVLRIVGSHAPSQLVSARFDTIAIVSPVQALVMISHELAMQAVEAAFASINGTGGYKVNVEGRVLNAVVRPDDTHVQPPQMPYVVLREHPETGTRHDDLMVSEWDVSAHFFVAETWSDFSRSSAVAMCRQISDDVKLIAMKDQSLSGTVFDFLFLGFDPSDAGVEPSDHFIEAVAMFHVIQYVNLGSLTGA